MFIITDELVNHITIMIFENQQRSESSSRSSRGFVSSSDKYDDMTDQLYDESSSESFSLVSRNSANYGTRDEEGTIISSSSRSNRIAKTIRQLLIIGR